MPYFQLQNEDDASLGVAEYGACKLCGASAIICPTTQTEDGLHCPACVLKGIRKEKGISPVKGRIGQLEEERVELRRRLAQIGREVSHLRRQLRHQTDYSR